MTKETPTPGIPEGGSERKKPAAGWYPHPKMPGTRRYWDGSAWTDHVAPAETSQPAKSVGAFTIARGVALGIGIVVGVVWLVAAIAGSDDDLDCATENARRATNGEPALNCDP